MNIKYNIKKYKKYLIIISISVILILFGMVVKKNNSIENNNELEEIYPQSQILVSIEGEVKFPNNYYVDENSNIEDLIFLAGGLTEDADTSYINLKKTLVNQEYIYIPKGNKETNKINLNKASLEELTTLKGIGETKAYNIILYRTIHGPFNKYDDLLNVEGITSKILSDIINEITLS